MKRIDFPAASADLDLFNLAYIGLNNPQAQVTPGELRTHGKILDKFEAVAIAQTDGSGYKLPKDQGATVVLEDAELALTKKLCDSFAWNVAISRKVVKLFDLLDQAPDYIVPAPDPASAS
jgi:hypothetical protein